MSTIKLEEKFYQRGKICSGNSYRMGRFTEKLKSGRTVVCGAIGGSITAGSSASAPEKKVR